MGKVSVRWFMLKKMVCESVTEDYCAYRQQVVTVYNSNIIVVNIFLIYNYDDMIIVKLFII